MTTDKILKIIQSKLDNLTGTMNIKDVNSTIYVVGTIATSTENPQEVIDSILLEYFEGKTFVNAVDINNGFNLIHDENVALDESPNLDEVKILYTGNIPLSAITPNEEYLEINEESFTRIENCYATMKFISPLILDANLKIIDGQLRYEMFSKYNVYDKIPVVVLNTTGVKADFLRLALNRSNEFKKWKYSEVDEFVDTVPQVAPLLEPLGFFGTNILPESYFSKTMMSYKLNKFNIQQSKYSQENTIEEWAKLREKEITEAHNSVKAKKKQKVIPTVSLFDLDFSSDDFIPTYDPQEEIQKQVEESKIIAEKVTNNYDKERKAIMEAKGIAWQNSRRETKDLAEENRNNYIKRINELSVDEETKEGIINSIDDFDTLKELDEYISKYEGEITNDEA